MAEMNQKNINIGLAAAVVVVVVLLFALNQVMARNVEQAFAQHAAKVAELDKTAQRLSEQNAELLAYLDGYHRGDNQRGDDLAKMKILIDDHQAKIDRIVQTIKELH